MKNQGLIKKLLSAILVLAFIAAPALDSLECVNCQEGHKAMVQASNKIQPPPAPSLHIDNGQKGGNESDQIDCPFCFLNVFGLTAASPNQTLFPSVSFQNPAAPKFISLDLSPSAKPPQA